jgi:hypothetical protein
MICKRNLEESKLTKLKAEERSSIVIKENLAINNITSTVYKLEKI